MPTGSYEGMVAEGVGSGSSVCGGREYDICGERLRNSLQVANSCSDLIQHGGSAPRLPQSPLVVLPPQSLWDLVQGDEVVDHHQDAKCKIARRAFFITVDSPRR